MATGAEVLSYLLPNSEWYLVGDDFTGITFIAGDTVTQAQFEAGFAQYDAWKAEQDAQIAADKAGATAKLEALGLTADDLKALGL
jgi:hypothetical protein